MKAVKCIKLDKVSPGYSFTCLSGFHRIQTLSLTLAVTTVLLITQQVSLAEDRPSEANIRIGDVRSELQRAAKTADKLPEVDSDGFALVEGDLDKAQQQYNLAEEQLLKQLKQVKVDVAERTEVEVSPSKVQNAVTPATRREARANADIDNLNATLDRTDAAIEELNQNISKQMASLQISPPAKVTTQTKVEKTTAAKKASVTNPLVSENAELKKQLAKLRVQHDQSQRDLEGARNRLLIAETEVERLAAIVQARAKADISQAAGVAPSNNPHVRMQAANLRTASQQRPTTTAVVQRAGAPQAPIIRSNTSQSDMPIATVIADKANLRIGPSLRDSPLMSVSNGTRLAVEKREGQWYRVIAPSGARAWVSADVVAFGRSASLSPDQTIRVKGFDAARESDNFKFIQDSE